jgi:hypothetical protein
MKPASSSAVLSAKFCSIDTAPVVILALQVPHAPPRQAYGASMLFFSADSRTVSPRGEFHGVSRAGQRDGHVGLGKVIGVCGSVRAAEQFEVYPLGRYPFRCEVIAHCRDTKTSGGRGAFRDSSHFTRSSSLFHDAPPPSTTVVNSLSSRGL